MLYLGRKRIASGGGTTTVTAHQFTNNVSDIKPDGASASLGVLDTIVRADHVHPITIATLNSLGVVKPNKALGTSIDANGNLSVEVANSSEIASRASQSKVIYTGNLNNSVKAALTDANHLTMDSTEQATARSVIGVDTVERLEVIYDKDSADADINWSYTSGIENGTTVSSKDFTPYKALRVTFATYRGNFIYYVDLTKKDLGDFSYKGAVSYTYLDSGLGVLVLFSNTNVNSDKNSITFESGFLQLSDNTTHSTYKVYKIEGVLA